MTPSFFFCHDFTTRYALGELCLGYVTLTVTGVQFTRIPRQAFALVVSELVPNLYKETVPNLKK
jgi:hypothetical protein